MRKVSIAETRRQVAREGKRWGLFPMTSVFGDCLVGEHVAMAIPLPCGVTIVEKVQSDITGVSMDYTFTHLLRGRKSRLERTTARRLEVAHEAHIARVQKDKEAREHEFAADYRNADKGRIILLR